MGDRELGIGNGQGSDFFIIDDFNACGSFEKFIPD